MTSSNRHALRRAAFGCALVLWATPAWADPSAAADLATARELYLEAKELRSSGDAKAALAKYRGAWATAPTPIIGVELGRTHMQLGELIEARETFLAVVRLQVEPDETKRSAQAREEASTLADELRRKIPTLAVEVRAPGVSEAKHASLTIDGANVALVSGAATRKINPGKHELVARVGASEKKESLELAEGENKKLVIDVAATDGPVASHAADGEAARSAPSGGLRPVLVFGGFGLAGAGVLVGGVTGIMALGKASSVKSECRGLACPESARGDVRSGRTLATVSTIGFGAAIVGAAAGMLGLLVVRPGVAGSQARPRVTPNAVAVTGGAWVGAEGTF